MSQWRITGGSYPARIWNKMMSKLTDGTPVEQFVRPDSIIDIKVCKKSGLAPGLFCPEEDIISDIGVKGREPKDFCNLHTGMESPQEAMDDLTGIAPAAETGIGIEAEPEIEKD